MSRTFAQHTQRDNQTLTLGLAPGLTPNGLTTTPSFFHGFATHPHIIARSLLTLADITATRYFNYTPEAERDPILSAHGDRLRAECFSACNSLYACLEIFHTGLDGGNIHHGTTNVDLNPTTRQLLANIARNELLHLNVGDDGLTVATPTTTATERPVQMPDRWVRALGNLTELHHDTTENFRVTAAGTRRFLATLPPATAQDHAGWLTVNRGALTVTQRPNSAAVLVSGLNRLSALKRLLPVAQELTIHSHPNQTPVLVSVTMPHARLTLSLTDQPWRGFSGEGALLGALAQPAVTEYARHIRDQLAFEPIIDYQKLSHSTALDYQQIRAGLAVLATSGQVGWNVHDGGFFHRELPPDPGRVSKDNPRLVAAQKLHTAHAAQPHPTDPATWQVTSGGTRYTVTFPTTIPTAAAAGLDPMVTHARCTCPWFLAHAGNRGPCKHVLAAYLAVKGTL